VNPPGKTLLLVHAERVLTMDDAGRELADGAVLIRGNRIEAVAPTAELIGTPADETIDLSGHLVLPGLVNTHHHMYQSLTRVVPAAQDSELFGWLRALYPIWSRLTPEMIRVSTLTASAELMLAGCTTSSDHLYVFPNGCRLDDSIEAAAEAGLRFHPTRGSMSVGESAGGLPPDSLVEDEDAILADSRRVIETFHDPARYAMVRVGIAPCSPFSVSRELMRESARLARSYGVRLHTHLAESANDVAYSRERFGATPAQYAADTEWLGADVWHAHCVQLDADGIGLFAASRTGIAHCPCSNMRLGSGIAPVRALLDAGVAVGLGVDGSASNDGGDLLAEARQALLLQRVHLGPGALGAREALRLATRGGATVLGRDDIGQLGPGFAADLVAIRLDDVAYAGARHDPVAALLFCAPRPVAWSIINGRVVVRDGAITTFDLRATIARHNELARVLASATH